MRISEILETTARRYGEMLLSCCLISAILKYVNDNGQLRDTWTVKCIIALLGLVAFYAVNVVLFRRCRFVLGNRAREYSVINCSAWLLHTATNLTVLELFGQDHLVYQYMYQLTQAGKLFGLDGLASALIFDSLIFIAIFVSQIGMLPILREAEKEMNCRYE